MMEGNFADYVKIYAVSGNGGADSMHLHRGKFVPKGGPDGGDGGHGGHIILKDNKHLRTLMHFKFQKHFRAEHDEAGGANRSFGTDGKDIYLEVPLGTIVKDAETEEVLFEITEDGQEVIALRGGKEGLGNWHFRTATSQTPRYVQPGLPGGERELLLEPKVLADVGLVGFPNAGKSTPLSVITSAKPKIGDYPFTTLKPNLGIVENRDFQSFVMADIPGIIEGAAEGKGLGHFFLRHIERNSLLLFLTPADANDIVAEYEVLLNELEKYNPELLDKQWLVAVFKLDMFDGELTTAIDKELTAKLKVPYLFTSSVSGKGIQKLKDELMSRLNN